MGSIVVGGIGSLGRWIGPIDRRWELNKPKTCRGLVSETMSRVNGSTLLPFFRLLQCAGLLCAQGRDYAPQEENGVISHRRGSQARLHGQHYCGRRVA